MGWPISRWPKGRVLLLLAAAVLACSSESDPSREPGPTVRVVIPAGADLAWLRDPTAGPRPAEVPLPDEEGKALKIAHCSGGLVGVFLDTLDLQLHSDSTPGADGVLRPRLGQVFVAGEGEQIVIPPQAAHLFLAPASGSTQDVEVGFTVLDKPAPVPSPSTERVLFVRWTGTEFEEVDPGSLRDGDTFRVEVRYDREPVQEQVLVRVTWDEGSDEQVLARRSLLEPNVFRSEELALERIGGDR